MAETVYLQGDGFLVTNARVVARDRTYALTHVSGVGGYDSPSSKVPAAILIALGILGALPTAWIVYASLERPEQMGAGLILVAVTLIPALLSLFIGVVIWSRARPTHVVQLSSAAGPEVILRSRDFSRAKLLVDAVNAAIAGLAADAPRSLPPEPRQPLRLRAAGIVAVVTASSVFALGGVLALVMDLPAPDDHSGSTALGSQAPDVDLEAVLDGDAVMTSATTTVPPGLVTDWFFCAELVNRDRLCPGSAGIPTKAQMERWHPACHDYCVDGVQQGNVIEPEEPIPALESGTWTISVSNTVNSARQTGGQIVKDSEQVTVPYRE